jgi:cobalt/nickel transport system permease protein
MHIAEGALSVTPQGIGVLWTGVAAAAAGTVLGLRRMDYERVPQVAMLSAVFFVVSLFPIPMGITSAHLVLAGLIGLVLGWAAFPALLVALFLQAVLFGDGGLTTLGINTTIMAVPAIVSFYLFRPVIHAKQEWIVFAGGFAAGAVGVILGALVNALALYVAEKQYHLLAYAVIGFHLPFAAVEGLITGSVVVFLRKVRPELLEAPLLATEPSEAPNA